MQRTKKIRRVIVVDPAKNKDQAFVATLAYALCSLFF
jgi:hypothetical protein